MKIKLGQKLKYASLFCGCGGFDLGFIQQDFHCVAAFDKDPIAVHVHRKNLNSPAQVCDLSEDDSFLSHLKGIDVIIAGTPCQGFSTAGRRELNDPRNGLLVRAGDIAAKVKPRIFILENVPTVKSGNHIIYWKSLCAILENAGYKIGEYLCKGIALGVPQIRKRLILFAWRSRKSFKISLPEKNGGVLRDVLSNIETVPNHEVMPLSKFSDMYLIAKKIKPGQKLSNVRGGSNSVHTWDIPEVFGMTTIEEKYFLCTIMNIRRRLRIRDIGDADPVPESALEERFGGSTKNLLTSLIRKGFVRQINGNYDLTHTFNGKFRRLRWDKPSFTVDTRFGNPRYFLHPQEDRGFSVREAARIQGFPDSFNFFGTLESQYRLIGNAVPPPVSASIAEFTKKFLLTDS